MWRGYENNKSGLQTSLCVIRVALLRTLSHAELKCRVLLSRTQKISKKEIKFKPRKLL